MIAPIRGRIAPHDEDAELMQQACDGDQAAFEELYRRHRRWVESFLASAGAGNESQDLAQEVFLRVYRARHNYRPEARFSTWLFTIVVNVAKNSRRSAARKPVIRATDLGLENSPWGMHDLLADHRTASPLSETLRAESAEQIQKAISTLNDREQRVLHFYYFQGLACSEIAERMQCSFSAVRSLLVRARGKARGYLRSYAETERDTSGTGDSLVRAGSRSVVPVLPR